MTWWWGLAVILLLAAAALLWVSARVSPAPREQAAPRRQRRRIAPSESLLEWTLDYLLRAGIQLTPRRLMISVASGLGILAVLLVVIDQRWSLFVLAGALLGGNLVLGWRARRLRSRLRAQLPGYLEQFLRELAVGASPERAFQRQIARSAPPLRNMLERVWARRELGLELHEGLVRESQLLKLSELGLLATALEVNQRHGGSLRDILGSFVTLLRQQERGRRELKALTGETRFTAVVLAVIPVLIGAYILLTNPEFLRTMWHSADGRAALWLALGLELSGCFVMWRMLKAI